MTDSPAIKSSLASNEYNNELLDATKIDTRHAIKPTSRDTIDAIVLNNLLRIDNLHNSV